MAENTLVLERSYNHFTMHYFKYTCAKHFRYCPHFKEDFLLLLFYFQPYASVLYERNTSDFPRENYYNNTTVLKFIVLKAS